VNALTVAETNKLVMIFNEREEERKKAIKQNKK
jgi:hypothetical protein